MPHRPSTTAFETDLLAELARRRHECLVQLQTLGGRQLALIEAEDMSQLMGVLAAKQRLLGELNELERGMDPFRGQPPDERLWRSPQLRQQCAELIARSEAVFAEIIAGEKQGETRLRRHRDQAAARLQDAHVATHARSAYVGDSYYSTRLDLSSE
jgi:hypothetical protein